MDAFDHLDDDLADLDVDWDALLAPVDARARALNSSDICAIYDSELLCPMCVLSPTRGVCGVSEPFQMLRPLVIFKCLLDPCAFLSFADKDKCFDTGG